MKNTTLLLTLLACALLLAGCAQLPGAANKTATPQNAPTVPQPPSSASRTPGGSDLGTNPMPTVRTTDLLSYQKTNLPMQCSAKLAYSDKPATLFIWGQKARLLAPLVQEGVMLKIDAIMTPENNYFNVQEFGLTNASPCTWLKVEGTSGYGGALAMAAQSVDIEQLANLPKGSLQCNPGQFGVDLFSPEGKVCSLQEVLKRQAGN